MKNSLFIIPFLLLNTISWSQQWTITEVGQLPEAVTNTPVCEGHQGDTLYIYSFGGLDNTLAATGIHLRSYRFNTVSGLTESIANLPDTLGKLGVAANRIGDIIYVTGGYHVLQNGTEITSNKVHRFNTQTNSWMSDAPVIPVATDDHVQSIWRDSLLFLVTGWRNSANIQHCQIFDPANNIWLSGTSLPNSANYKSFGASGIIIGDTIFFYGGASSWDFSVQNKLRMGIINPSAPSDVTWSISTPDAGVFGYRMAATKVNNQAHWIGGASFAYNFDAIDYNGTGVVSPNNRDLYIQSGTNFWYQDTYDTIPMDLRGIGNDGDSIKYLMGGMFSNQVVSDRIYRLNYIGSPILNINEPGLKKIELFPNPSEDILYLKGITKEDIIQITGLNGVLIAEFKSKTEIDLSNYEAGSYFLRIITAEGIINKKIIKK